MNAIRVTIAALIMSSPQTWALDPSPSAAQLREWSAGECVIAGAHVGIDYARALSAAIAKEPDGLAALFRFTTTEWFMGAAAENHCAIIVGLLQRWGDRDFARLLRKQPARVRKAVIDAIDYSFPYPGWKRTQFPRTYALAEHEHTPPE
jgi:hypothetical protein